MSFNGTVTVGWTLDGELIFEETVIQPWGRVERLEKTVRIEGPLSPAQRLTVSIVFDPPMVAAPGAEDD